MIKLFKKNKKWRVQTIDNFDEEAFLEANPEIVDKLKTYKDIKDYLKREGFKLIKEGKLYFHPDYEKYNEKRYLEINKDIKEAIKNGNFRDGFEHFAKFGYKEIIENIRYWDKRKKPKKQLTLVLGIPRSGITLLTALLGSHDKITEWFMPYSTRKNFGIEKFTEFDVIKQEYFKAFPQEKEFLNNVLISESTSDENTVKWLKESFDNLKEEADIKIIWIKRDLNNAYVSFIEAAREFWGANGLEIDESSYKNFIDMAKRSYKQIAEFIYNYDNIIVEYKELINNPHKTLKKLMNFINLDFKEEQITAYRGRIKDYKVAGCQKFFNYYEVLRDREDERKEEWEKHKYLIDKLDEKTKHFIRDFKKITKSLKDYERKVLKENFDYDYYIETYEDIKNSGVDPLHHYITYGWKENRNPTPYFDTEWYRSNIEIGNMNPFSHWLLVGKYFYNLGKTNKQIATLEHKREERDTSLFIIDPEKYEIKDYIRLVAPKYENPKVSIIIPAYNQAKYTMACIETILTNTKDVTFEIIVMDDKSPDKEAREIGKYLENITFISNEVNLGFLENCNKGAKLAKGEYILFLNNDTNVQPKWLSSLVDLIESDSKIGMVGSKLVYPTGEQQEAGGIVWKDASAWNFGRLDDPTKPEYNYVKETDYISGAAIMIRKDLWNKIGGFDKRYIPAYFEDTDLAFEVRRHGYKVMLQPKSVVVHFEGISHGTDTQSGIKSYQVKNMQKFYEKWKDVLEKEHFDNGEHVFLARDRTRNKKHLLYIDHYLPHYDQDAGSRATYQYIKLLTKMGFQIHFIGDNFYHYPGKPYLEALQQLGVEVLYGNWYAQNWKKWLEENGKYFDYAVISRPHIAIKYIDAIKEFTNAKIIYMGHDLHFLRERREYEVKGDEKYLESSNEWLKKEMKLINESDVSWFFSDAEKEEILKQSKRAKVDVIPLYVFDKFKENVKPMKERKDIMFVGGFGHSPNVDAVKWFIENVWSKIKDKNKDMKFYVIGSRPPEEIQNLANDRVIVTGYVDDKTLEEFYDNCKVVVAPLRYGAGVKGKIVEALYYNLPVVTTLIGAEGFYEAEDVMKIADNADDFAKAVLEIYENDDIAEEMSKKAREYCKKYFSQENAKEIVEKSLFGEEK